VVRVLAELEQRLIRARLEAQTALIEGPDLRVTKLKNRTDRLQKTDQVVDILTRRGCPPLHAWHRALRRCVKRQ
jgi:hypothetical protein